MRFLKRLPAILLLVASSRLAAQTLTITNATVVDVTTGALHRGSTIVVDGKRIVSVGPSTSARPSRGQIVDGRGMYVIPGLWDMHTHAYFGWNQEFGDTYVLPMFIANGITGIRDMGSDLDAVLRARGEVAAHRLVGPRLVVSGPMLDGPLVAFAASIAIKTPDDGRKAVDLLKARGVDFIKIQSGVPRDAYFAIAAEAKARGIEFEGHVPDAIRASEAIAAGQRSFEHLIGIFEASTPDEDQFLQRRYGEGKNPSKNKSLAAFLNRYDPAREGALIQRLAKDSVWQCPTLFWERGQWLVDVIDFRKDPDSAYTPRTWIDKKYPASQKSILASMDADSLAVRRRFVEHELDIVHKLHVAERALSRRDGHPGGRLGLRHSGDQPASRGCSASSPRASTPLRGAADRDDQPGALPQEDVRVRHGRTGTRCRSRHPARESAREHREHARDRGRRRRRTVLVARGARLASRVAATDLGGAMTVVQVWWGGAMPRCSVPPPSLPARAEFNRSFHSSFPLALCAPRRSRQPPIGCRMIAR